MIKRVKVKVSNCIIEYIKFGNGNKPLVILPGLSLKSVLDSATAIEKQYSIFCEDFTVYLFDRRKNIPESYSVSDMADDTYSAIKMLNIDKINLFGVSQGGMIALSIAVKHPEFVEKLVLGSTALYVDKSRTSVINKWIELAKSKDRKKLSLSFGKYVYSEKVFEEFKSVFSEMAESITDCELDRFLTLAEGTEGYDLRDKLDIIKCPVFAIGDTEDRVLGNNATAEMPEYFKSNPFFEMYLYKGFGHAVYDLAPDYTKRLYDFFVRQ